MQGTSNGKEREERPVLRKTKAGELTASRELKNETEENLRGNKMNDDIQKGERAREMRGPELNWSTKVRAAPILMTDSKCNNSSMCSLNIKTRSRRFKSVSDSIWPTNSACSCVCYISELEKWFKISQSLHWFIAIQLGNSWLTDQKQRLKRGKNIL